MSPQKGQLGRISLGVPISQECGEHVPTLENTSSCNIYIYIMMDQNYNTTWSENDTWTHNPRSSIRAYYQQTISIKISLGGIDPSRLWHYCLWISFHLIFSIASRRKHIMEGWHVMNLVMQYIIIIN